MKTPDEKRAAHNILRDHALGKHVGRAPLGCPACRKFGYVDADAARRAQTPAKRQGRA